ASVWPGLPTPRLWWCCVSRRTTTRRWRASKRISAHSCCASLPMPSCRSESEKEVSTLLKGAPAYLSQALTPLADMAAWKAFVEAALRADRKAGSLRVLEAAGLAVDLSMQAQSPELLAAGAALLAERDF